MNLVRRRGGRMSLTPAVKKIRGKEEVVWSEGERRAPVRRRPGYSGRLGTKERKMRDVFSRVHRFIVSEDGPTAVEYAVMLGLIVVAIVGVVSNLAKSVSGTFSTVSSTLGS